MLRSCSEAEFGLAMNDLHSQRKYATPSNKEHPGQTQSSCEHSHLSPTRKASPWHPLPGTSSSSAIFWLHKGHSHSQGDSCEVFLTIGTFQNLLLLPLLKCQPRNCFHFKSLRLRLTNPTKVNKNLLFTHSKVCSLLNTGVTEMNTPKCLLSVSSLSRRRGKKRIQ